MLAFWSRIHFGLAPCPRLVKLEQGLGLLERGEGKVDLQQYSASSPTEFQTDPSIIKDINKILQKKE